MEDRKLPCGNTLVVAPVGDGRKMSYLYVYEEDDGEQAQVIRILVDNSPYNLSAISKFFSDWADAETTRRADVWPR